MRLVEFNNKEYLIPESYDNEGGFEEFFDMIDLDAYHIICVKKFGENYGRCENTDT